MTNMNEQVGYSELDQQTILIQTRTVTIFLEQKLSVSLPRAASIQAVRCSVPIQRLTFQEW